MFLKLLVGYRVSSLASEREIRLLPLVPQDSSIVDEYCDSAERVQSRLDNGGTVRHGRRVHNSLSAN